MNKYPCEKCFFYHAESAYEEPFCHGTDEDDYINGTLTDEFYNLMIAYSVPDEAIRHLWKLKHDPEFVKVLNEIEED